MVPGVDKGKLSTGAKQLSKWEEKRYRQTDSNAEMYWVHRILSQICTESYADALMHLCRCSTDLQEYMKRLVDRLANK